MMPLYDYVCEACGHVFETKKSIDDPAPGSCPKCKQGPVSRYFTSESSGFVEFKGKGWFKTDGKY